MFYLYTPSDAEPVYPFTLTDLRRKHPNVSFPSDIDSETAALFNCHPVISTDMPELSGKKAVRIMPENINGVWHERWALEDYSAEELLSQWSNVRAERNAKLLASDWTQLADAPLTEEQKAEWAILRQKWRDITNQDDPFSIVWPDAVIG